MSIERQDHAKQMKEIALRHVADAAREYARCVKPTPVLPAHLQVQLPSGANAHVSGRILATGYRDLVDMFLGFLVEVNPSPVDGDGDMDTASRSEAYDDHVS